MDLFVCDTCNHVDAVDLAYNDKPMPQPTENKGVKLECTKCQTGVWHEFFPYELYKDGFDVVVNRPSGFGLGN